ncbi:MAG: hypothetical protein ABH828_04970, partial [archaeon]
RKMGNYLENNKREDIKLAVSLGDKETLVFPEALAGKSYLTKTNVPFGLVRIAVGRPQEFQPHIDYIVKGIHQSLQ